MRLVRRRRREGRWRYTGISAGRMGDEDEEGASSFAPSVGCGCMGRKARTRQWKH
jgi:hypothetical protein